MPRTSQNAKLQKSKCKMVGNEAVNPLGDLRTVQHSSTHTNLDRNFCARGFLQPVGGTRIAMLSSLISRRKLPDAVFRDLAHSGAQWWEDAVLMGRARPCGCVL